MFHCCFFMNMFMTRTSHVYIFLPRSLLETKLMDASAAWKNMVYPSESPIQVKSQEIATYNLNLKLKDECYEDVWRKYCVALILFPLHFGLGANQTFHVSSMFPRSRQIMPGCYCNRCHAIFRPGVRGPEIFSPWWQPKSQRKELGCPGRCCNWCQPWSVTFSICWFC